jgi:hypothetical protein
MKLLKFLMFNLLLPKLLPLRNQLLLPFQQAYRLIRLGIQTSCAATEFVMARRTQTHASKTAMPIAEMVLVVEAKTVPVVWKTVVLPVAMESVMVRRTQTHASKTALPLAEMVLVMEAKTVPVVWKTVVLPVAMESVMVRRTQTHASKTALPLAEMVLVMEAKIV